MSAGLADGGHSSALARLVARALRPAVRLRGEALGFDVVEIARPAAAALELPAAAAGVRHRTPPDEAPRTSSPTEAPAREAPGKPANAAVALPVEARRPLVHRADERVPATLSARVSAPITVRPPGFRPAAPSEPAAERDPTPPEPQAGPSSEAARSARAPVHRVVPTPLSEPAGRTAVAETELAETWSAPLQSQAPHAEVRTPQPSPAAADEHRSPDRHAPPHPPAPAPERAAPAAPPPDPGPPPQVVIDRIEVITPPARAPEPDPFVSLAARRVGASRHGGMS